MQMSQTSQSPDFRTVAEYAPDIICRFDRDYRLLYVNPAIEKATGIPAAKFINKTQREIGMPDDFSDFWDAHVHYVFSTGKQTTIQFPFPSPVGNRYFHSLLAPEFDINGSVQ